MSDNRKKSRRRRSIDETPELTPIEKSIAKYLRFQCPTKKGMLMGTQVPYFNGTKAVDCLAESKWSSIRSKTSAESTKESKHPICFSSRHDAVQMLRKFLENDMFRRVVKVYKEDKLSSEQVSSNNAGDTSQSNTPRPVRQRKTKTTTSNESTTKDDDAKEKEKAKKKKFKFEPHEDQTFIESLNDFYVWIYSPTTIKQYIMGALLVIGCIGVCLFPLWPAEVRTGVYYLSMVLASLLGVLLSLAVIKYIIFAGVWLLTMGKIKFWLLPNLTEDVGFFESFVPLYTLNVATKKKATKKNEKKENADDDEDDDEKESNKNQENLNEIKKKTNKSNTVGQTESEQDDEDKEKSSSRSSSIDDIEEGNKPQKSSDEDFEMLSKEELETK